MPAKSKSDLMRESRARKKNDSGLVRREVWVHESWVQDDKSCPELERVTRKFQKPANKP